MDLPGYWQMSPERGKPLRLCWSLHYPHLNFWYTKTNLYGCSWSMHCSRKVLSLVPSISVLQLRTLMVSNGPWGNVDYMSVFVTVCIIFPSWGRKMVFIKCFKIPSNENFNASKLSTRAGICIRKGYWWKRKHQKAFKGRLHYSREVAFLEHQPCWWLSTINASCLWELHRLLPIRRMPT